MKDRLKELRKSLNMTQQEFADRVSSKQSSIAQYEIGRSAPPDPLVTLICREFNVNETWLRFGDGEMFRERGRHQVIAEYFADLVSDADSFQAQFVSVLARNKDNALFWQGFEKIIEDLYFEKFGKPYEGD